MSSSPSVADPVWPGFQVMRPPPSIFLSLVGVLSLRVAVFPLRGAATAAQLALHVGPHLVEAVLVAHGGGDQHAVAHGLAGGHAVLLLGADDLQASAVGADEVLGPTRVDLRDRRVVL